LIINNITRYQIAPERLELALTESVLVDMAERHGETFKRLKQAGGTAGD
jgi:EAL domain-containing protein (putative c-di-GMP-specific phosphodiesterase class I)